MTNTLPKFLKQNKGVMKYGKNISWLFVEKAFRIVLGITLGVWVARYLGPKDFGILNFANSFVGILGAVAVLGLEDIVIREILQNKERTGTVLGTAFILKALASLLLFLLVYMIIHLLKYEYQTQVIILIFASSFFFQSLSIIDYYFRSQVLSQYIVVANLASLIVCSLLRVALILYQLPLIYFVWVALLDIALCTALQTIFFIRKNDFFKNWIFDFSMAKKLLCHGWPLILTGILISIDTRIDQVMLGKMASPQATGYYAAATRLNESIYWLFDVLAITLFPAIINAKQQDHAKYASRIQLLFTFMALFFIVSCIPIVFFSKNIISILYGKQYALAADILKVNALCGFFIAMKCTQTRWAVAENLQTYNMIIQISGVFCNILLNFFFIKKFGVMGAAYATLLAHALSLFLVTGLIKPMRPSLFIMTKGVIDILNLKFLQWRSLV